MYTSHREKDPSRHNEYLIKHCTSFHLISGSFKPREFAWNRFKSPYHSQQPPISLPQQLTQQQPDLLKKKTRVAARESYAIVFFADRLLSARALKFRSQIDYGGGMRAAKSAKQPRAITSSRVRPHITPAACCSYVTYNARIGLPLSLSHSREWSGFCDHLNIPDLRARLYTLSWFQNRDTATHTHTHRSLRRLRRRRLSPARVIHVFTHRQTNAESRAAVRLRARSAHNAPDIPLSCLYSLLLSLSRSPPPVCCLAF